MGRSETDRRSSVRRLYTRVELRQRADASRVLDPDTNSIQRLTDATILDLSAGGARLSTTDPSVELHDHLIVQFEFAGQPYAVIGKVRWLKQFDTKYREMGLRFVSLTNQQKDQISHAALRMSRGLSMGNDRRAYWTRRASDTPPQ